MRESALTVAYWAFILAVVTNSLRPCGAWSNVRAEPAAQNFSNDKNRIKFEILFRMSYGKMKTTLKQSMKDARVEKSD